MFLVKKNSLPKFNKPISVKLFGQNKTYRGFILLPLLSAFIAFIGSLLAGPFLKNSFFDLCIGFGMGIVYLLSELPNSFIKRRLQIPNGGYSKNFKFFQIIMDRADSLIGIFIFYYFIVCISITDSIILFVGAMILSFLTSLLLKTLRIKRSI